MESFLEIEKCVLCGSPAGEATVLFDLRENQKLLQCPNCDMIFNSRCRVDFENVYDNDYYETSKKDSAGGYFAYDKMEPAIKKTYRFATSFIKDNKPEGDNQTSVLDIGCGYGFFLKQFLTLSSFDLVGVELSKKAADEARKLIPNIINKPFESTNFIKTFDFIVALDVIEHFFDPVSFSKKVHSVLKKDGYFLMTTPNVGSYWFKILKKRWPGIHPYCHNVYFSPRTIRLMAEKCGFEVLRIQKVQHFYVDVRHIRKRLLQLFPISAKIFGVFKVFDSVIVPFLNGGELQVILKRRA